MTPFAVTRVHRKSSLYGPYTQYRKMKNIGIGTVGECVEHEPAVPGVTRVHRKS